MKEVSQSRDRTKQLIIKGRVEGQGWAERRKVGTWSRNGFSARIKRAISRGLGEKTEGGFDSSRTTSANTFFPPSLPQSAPRLLSLPSLFSFLSVARLRFTIPRQKLIAWKRASTLAPIAKPFLFLPLSGAAAR